MCCPSSASLSGAVELFSLSGWCSERIRQVSIRIEQKAACWLDCWGSSLVFEGKSEGWRFLAGSSSRVGDLIKMCVIFSAEKRRQIAVNQRGFRSSPNSFCSMTTTPRRQPESQRINKKNKKSCKKWPESHRALISTSSSLNP